MTAVILIACVLSIPIVAVCALGLWCWMGVRRISYSDTDDDARWLE